MPNPKNIKTVAELKDKLSRAKAIYFTDYLGLDVGNITNLRSEFFKADVEFTVAKNTLLKLAAYESKIEGLDEFLSGPTAIAISYNEPSTPAKVISAFIKNNNSDKPHVKGILFEGNIFAGDEFSRIANLPTKQELLSILISILNGPLTKLVRTLSAPMVNAVNALNNLKEQKNT